MTLKLNGSTAGSVSIDAPADTSPTGTDVTLTLPTSAGSSGQYLQTNGSGALSWQTIPNVEWTSYGKTPFTNGGSSETLSGISTDATCIKIIVSSLSLSNTTVPHFRLKMGNGSESSTGYTYSNSYSSTDDGAVNTGSIKLFNDIFSSAANVYSGTIEIASSGDHMVSWWSFTGSGDTNRNIRGAGLWTGGNAIDRIILNTASTFDAGHFAVYSL